ncbi:TPA: hypothetical protein DD712_01655 [Candidatus Acetothermia bacterium]|nr:hypothetical protein [Candidatus Acetothermia bacterium]
MPIDGALKITDGAVKGYLFTVENPAGTETQRLKIGYQIDNAAFPCHCAGSCVIGPKGTACGDPAQGKKTRDVKLCGYRPETG